MIYFTGCYEAFAKKPSRKWLALSKQWTITHLRF